MVLKSGPFDGFSPVAINVAGATIIRPAVAEMGPPVQLAMAPSNVVYRYLHGAGQCRRSCHCTLAAAGKMYRAPNKGGSIMLLL